MKMSFLTLLCAGLLAASCDRAPQNKPASSVEAVAPQKTENVATTSIIRPEVVEEVAAPAPPPPKKPLQAILPFGDSGADLNDEAKLVIDKLLADPIFAEGGPITLTGHSDSTGSDADNMAASRRRAEAVRDYLIGKGVPTARMNVVALGERRPLEPNARPDGSDFPEGRRRNRRVDMLVTPSSNEAPAQPAADAQS